MIRANAEKQRPQGRPWRKNTLFCCACFRGEEKDPLQDRQERINGGPQLLHLDQQGSSEKEAIQITVEDLGIVNAGFSLLEEDPLTLTRSITCSARSESGCQRALKKKRLKTMCSLPTQPQGNPAIACNSGKNDDEEEEEEGEDSFMFQSGTNSMAASENLLTQPVINLIPPTPSDVAEDEPSFDVDSEENAAHPSDDKESYEENRQRDEVAGSTEEFTLSEESVSADSEEETAEGRSDQREEETESESVKERDEDEARSGFLCGANLVAPVPDYPQTNDPSGTVVSCTDMLKADLCPPAHANNMDTFIHQRRPLIRSCSVGDSLSRSATFPALTQTSEQQETKVLPQQRRITVAASYMPQFEAQDGNFPAKDAGRKVSKSLAKLNTDEVCEWFASIGLQKCLPFIREAKLSGAEIAAVDLKILDILHISTMEDREHLLSAIFNELLPPNPARQKQHDSGLAPSKGETFTSSLTSMSKSKSSSHVSCLSMNRRSFRLRSGSPNFMAQRNSHLIEITVNASEQIVHLRTPKDTTVTKVMDSCLKTLGMLENKHLYTVKETPDSTEELSPDQQIGALLASVSGNRQLELHLCKKDKPVAAASQSNSEVNNSTENCSTNRKVQVNQPAKEERIRELNQQVDSLQNVILQVQDLHHDLVAFCSELKNMDGDVNADRLASAELRQRLDLVKRQLNDKRQSLEALRDNINNSATHKKKQLEVHLLEKMKLNCQVFKEEISIVHLNRQVAHLQNALQESSLKETAQRKSLPIGSLSQLLSLQSPAMLLVVQENRNPEGRYGFTCRYREGSGLIVIRAGNSQLCVYDRLVEVNSVSVVNSSLEELMDVLCQSPSAQIVVLRQPPSALSPLKHPILQQRIVNPQPQTVCPGSAAAPMETPRQRKVIAI
ncbi:uncharacterized protein V6R79_017272 [Siganus canaliculatus]